MRYEAMRFPRSFQFGIYDHKQKLWVSNLRGWMRRFGTLKAAQSAVAKISD